MATRKEELAAVKAVIEGSFAEATHGLFFTRNTVGDEMETIFDGKFFTVDICYGYRYFEVFGCDEDEKAGLKAFYDERRSRLREARNG